jgi:outer membrane scaffolding protein for murein synthesis (MipA/OmpV family)
VSTDITVTDGAISGTMTTSVAGNEETVEVSGDATVESDALQNLDITPAVGATALSCS